MGCLGVGEAARGEQLIANQGQEWMGIRATSSWTHPRGSETVTMLCLVACGAGEQL